MRITEIVKHLLIINVIIHFLVQGLVSAGFNIPSLAISYPPSPWFSPYQIVTHMFVHADLNHLFFNMLMLFFMGPSVETRLGGKKFLFVYLSAGILSSFFDLGVSQFLTQLNIYDMSSSLSARHLGASGAIFGIIAAYGLLFPERKVMLLIPPVPIKGKYLTMALIGLGVLTGFGQNIGHMAHLGGAVIGGIIVYYWLKKREI